MTAAPDTIILKGDISGIQEFIFNVKSNDAAKELKGRSFFIKLLVEVAIQYFLDEFGLNETHLQVRSKVSTSGGNFILILPATPDFEAKVQKAQYNFTNALQYAGLHISIACVKQSKSYEQDIAVLNTECNKEKYRFYLNNIKYFDPFDKNMVTFETSSGGEQQSYWVNFTSLIRQNNAFLIRRNTNHDLILNFKPKGVELAGYEVFFNKEGKGKLLEDFLESLFPLKNNQKIKEFKELSESDSFNYQKCEIIEKGGEEGVNKLGILAMDVDGLGSVMALVKTVQEHTILDNQLRSFFNSRLKEIINNETLSYHKKCKKGNWISIPKYKNKIYSVTAGGDDSFFVGKWNTILDFAIMVNQEFKKAFPYLTISAGMVIVDPKFPVIRFAELVESALREAKYHYQTSKGNICLFGEVVKWDNLAEINNLRELLKKSNLSSSLLARARISANKIDDYDSFRLEDFWKIGYYLRNVKKDTKNPLMEKLEEYILKSIDSNDPLIKRNYRKILPIAARLAELDHR